MTKVVRRKVPTADGTPHYEVLRDGVLLGTATMHGTPGRDNYPWGWSLELDQDSNHPRGKATGTTDTLREAVELIDIYTRGKENS